MADAALLSTCEVPTATPRGPQPQAITPQQIADVTRTWKMVEEELGLLEAGIELFKKYEKRTKPCCHHSCHCVSFFHF